MANTDKEQEFKEIKWKIEGGDRDRKHFRKGRKHQKKKKPSKINTLEENDSDFTDREYYKHQAKKHRGHQGKHHNHHNKDHHHHKNEDDYEDYDLDNLQLGDLVFVFLLVSLICCGCVKCLKAIRKKGYCPGCRKRKQDKEMTIARNENNIQQPLIKMMQA